ncbi:hypothetical protein ACRE_042560 [Hapsidospora chrysogenum ATCC 11550]|uniref:Sas10 C-terminal domain-containing protein n=1 Tax=Hapsidospora chrysogenum (strain ATCC 11550 / CBS 779.69 / DSM 880 / IAM 14645 / JCM 23072 / IMI 49137) TaxID=857340 RepID=A0A086T6H8_HAPC1|nr:hypothetical protein ACRE_042560 [Hapsidospora chrysogenum ATCC 11550]
MAKKRKASRNAQPSGPKELDPADARLAPVSTYEDVANSEDEYFIKRDELMLNDEPGSKRRRTEDDDIEFSDEEILGYQDTDEDEAAAKPPPAKSKKAAKKSKLGDSDDEAEGDEEEEEGDEGWWGASKKEYYDADNIETEGDALEEEAEAKRLQQKKLSKMTDEDFIFDGDEWLAAEPEGAEDEERVTEVLKDIEVTDDMGPEERYRMLKSRYPEFEYLVGELQEKKPILEELRSQAKSKGGKSLEAVKYWVLGCYVAALASYFAILTSPARDVSKVAKPLDPSDLRDHEIMETLVTTREAWRKIEDLKPALSPEDATDVIELPVEVEKPPQDSAEKKKLKKKLAKEDKAAAEKRAKKLAKAKEVEETVADLYDLPLTDRKAKKQSKEPTARGGSDSDFGEEAALDARTAAEKAARKKSLKFYTSQIAQKANRRAGAGRDAGGDMDIPYRERLKDRQARLLREAERRGQKDSKRGADLGDNSDGDDDDDEASAANAIRNDEDEYYDMVAHKAQQKKEDKAARYAAYAAASKADRVVENEEVGEDGKRKITYAIEKNKGLTPRRKKDVRNPRVKKRKQYDAKKKKLASMKPIWKGGEPKGGYRGETSGINTAVIKSVKL